MALVKLLEINTTLTYLNVEVRYEHRIHIMLLIHIRRIISDRRVPWCWQKHLRLIIPSHILIFAYGMNIEFTF
jgi:hypothetical protein